MKIAIIGAGSTYTPELVEGIVRLRESLPVTELVLHDTSRTRLDVVGSAAVRILRAQGWDGEAWVTTDLDSAVDSATAVLLQIRVGGQAARHLDETIPLACGCIGQETTGAGGFSKALRTVPVILDIAQRVRERAGEEAWIIDFTNPVGIVTRALLDAGHRAVGLCNVAIGFQRLFAQWLHVSADHVRLGHAGLNHLTWIRSVTVHGEDALPGLLETRGAELADHVELPRGLLTLLGAVPSYYLRYFYMHDEVLEELRTSPSRADQVRAVEEELLALYADPALERSPELLSKRGGAHYSDAALNLLTSLTQDVGDVQVVDMRNNGIIAGLPDDAVVEVPAVIARDGPGAVDVPAPEEPELALMRHVAAYERLTVEAARTGDRDVAMRALLAHPLIGQWGPAEKVLADLLQVHRELLPRDLAMTGLLLVAVDGGNSKTDVVLLHSDGTVAGAVRGSGSNPHSVGVSGAVDLIGELIEHAWRRGAHGEGRRPAIHAGAFFLAGADQADDVRDLHEAIAVRRWTDDVVVGNDTLALLWAGSASGFGVAVVVGAGVNGIGRAPSGREAHFGALGAVTGDWGGGSGIGLAALGAAVRAEEGRAPATALSAVIAGHFAKPSASAVALAVHRREIAGDRLGELPALVFQVAERRDTEALAIVDRQAEEVVGFAVAALRRTGQTEEATEVVLGGSVIAAAPGRLIDRVQDGIRAVAPRAEIVVWRGPPVVGAAVAVLQHHGSDEAAQLRLRAELTERRITAVNGAVPEEGR